MAAVLAVLASTQVAAATVTVRHQGAATSPVRGSTMWCTVRPAAPPGAPGGAGGGEAARGDADDQVGVDEGALVVVADRDAPAAVRGGPGDPRRRRRG